MIVACPYCAGVIVLDETKVSALKVSGDATGHYDVEVTFFARHRCATRARGEWVQAAT